MALIHDNPYFLQNARRTEYLFYLCYLCSLSNLGGRGTEAHVLLEQELHKYTVSGGVESVTSCWRTGHGVNSVANLRKSLEYLSKYEEIHCYLDNDLAGQKTVETFVGMFGETVKDESGKYAEYKDLNDLLWERKRQTV